MVKPGGELSGGVARAEPSQRRCSRLVSDLVHQVAQPLTIMQGLLESALVPSSTSAQYTSLLETLRREVDRLSRMVRQVRDVAEIASDVEEELALPLVPLVKRTVEQMAPGAEAKELKIQIDAPREIVVWAGQRRLEWGLQKLISGALQRSRKCGKVRISITSSSAVATLRISDQGPDVFSPSLGSWPGSSPCSLATPRNSKGEGLEWALTQWVFESSGANLVVRNRAKHQCVVTVTLPLPVGEDK